MANLRTTLERQIIEEEGITDTLWSGEPIPLCGDRTAKILIVDDQPKNLLALEAILEGVGPKLVRAGSGEEALRYLLTNDVALVLLDVKMPGMDGFETARLIRERERSKTTPIIFLTAANNDERMMFEGYSAGGVDYIVKPFIAEILRAKVDVFLNLAAARRELEEEVLRRRAAERELEAAAERLRARAVELEAANQELSAFLYSASHDLRAPLRHIDGFCNILLDTAAPSLEADHQNYLKRITHSSQRMGKLLDHLVALSKAGRTEVCPREVNLNDLLDEVMRIVASETHGRNIRWIRGSLPMVQGDPILLYQVIENLIYNAIKFTRGRDPAEIEIGCRTRKDKAVVFVRDNGVGFDMRYVRKLFRAFQRLHSPAEFEGAGVGLAIVHRVIHRHGGEVWAEGVVDRGATFYFSLPCIAGEDGE